MNVFVQFYIDWTIQFLFTAVFYIFLLTSSLFFVGIGVYINGMVADLRISLSEFDDEDTNTRNVTGGIRLHQQMLKWEI